MFLTSLQLDVRKGVQLPRIESVPLFVTSAADDAVDLAAAAGLVLDPWQEYVLRGSLGERADGRWAAFRACLVLPRQNGKNAVLEARELAGALLFGEKLIIHTAHEFKTTYNSMVTLMNRLRTSELMEYVRGFDGEQADDIRDVDGFKTGNNPGITFTNGAQIMYAARSKGSGRGFTGDLVILDEAYALKSSEMDALLPTMAAKSIEGNPQVWFTSSAGMADSDLLQSLRRQGVAKSSERLAYYEWSAEDDADSLDREAWYQANPGLGYRISEEFIQDEFETLTKEGQGSDEGFRRERLGIWAPDGVDPIFPRGAWERQAMPGLVLGSPVVAADMRAGLNMSASVAVAGSVDGGAGVTVARHLQGAEIRSEDDVVALVVEILDLRNLDFCVVDGYAENEALIRKLEDAGVTVLKLTQADMANGAVGFTAAVSTSQLWHSNDPVLNAAVAAAGKKSFRETMFVWSQFRSIGDITALRAATAAWWVFASQAQTDGDPLAQIF